MLFKSKFEKSVLLAGGLSLLAACGGSGSDKVIAPPKVTPPPPVVTQFDYQKAIDETVSENVPGVILYVENPQGTFLGAAGLANVENSEPMQTYSVMPAGSAGKKLTALLVLLLEEEGLLSLDDKMSDYLDETTLAQIENSQQMTIRQLLNHTAGVFDYLDVAMAETFYNALLTADTETLKLDEFALQFALNQRAYSLPGEAFNYSNTGYLLVGLILDKVLGEHHSVAMRNRIFEPFGMSSSFYGGIEKDMGDIISGYFSNPALGVIDTKPYYESLGVADSPLRSNVEDLALLLKNIVSEDSPLSADVSESFFDQASTSILSNNKQYGLGIFKEVMNGKTVYHHGGLEAGYTTANVFIRETQTSITAFFNCGLSAACEAESDKLVQTLLENELK